MLKGNLMRHLLSIFVFLTGFSVASISYAEKLKVCYDQWVPMTIFPSENSYERGVVIDMLEYIYETKGYELEYYEVPLARGLDMVASGLCDMLPEYLHSMGSENNFVYAEEATFAYTTAFVVRHDDPWRYNGIQSIKGKRIATGPGWDYSSASADYQSYIKAPENENAVEVIAGYEDVVDRIFHMIKENRVDVYADNEIVLQHTLNRLGLSDDLKIVYPGLENKLVEYPIFSQNMPDERRQTLIKIWNEGRLSLQGEKEKAFLKKYNVTFTE